MKSTYRYIKNFPLSRVPDDNTWINDDDAFNVVSILAAEILSSGRREFDQHDFKKLPTRVKYTGCPGEHPEFEIKNHKKKKTMIRNEEF